MNTKTNGSKWTINDTDEFNPFYYLLTIDKQLSLIHESFLTLSVQGSVPYGITSGDYGSWDTYEPAIADAENTFNINFFNNLEALLNETNPTVS
jgi:hypothetical protein